MRTSEQEEQLIDYDCRFFLHVVAQRKYFLMAMTFTNLNNFLFPWSNHGDSTNDTRCMYLRAILNIHPPSFTFDYFLTLPKGN